MPLLEKNLAMFNQIKGIKIFFCKNIKEFTLSLFFYYTSSIKPAIASEEIRERMTVSTGIRKSYS